MNDSVHVIFDLEERFNQKGVVTANRIYFVRKRIFDQHQIRSIVNANELNSIHFNDITTDFFSIGDPFSDSLVSYTKSISFIDCNVTEGFFIESARFINGFYISNLHQTGHWINFSRAVFDNGLLFWNSNFENGHFDIVDCYFKDEVDMASSKFEIPFRIYKSTFDSTFILKYSTFNNTFLIQDSKLYNLFLNGCSFQYKPKFNRVTILDTLDLSYASFENGVDLRRMDLSKVNAIFLENTFYPPGELILYWEQIKGELKPKISLSELSNDKNDNYKRIEEIYNLLYNNYIAKGDKTSADKVKYELAWQKDIIVGGFWQWLYGVSLGYGYEPLRYLFFPVLITIIIFWFIWYHKYYNIIAYILNKEIDTDLELNPHYSIEFPIKKRYWIQVIDHKNISPKINFITKFWHALHFSASVLVGIRFKKDWIRFSKKHKYGINSFLWVVSFEYIIGKLYILLLFILIKVQPFENWKSFLGL